MSSPPSAPVAAATPPPWRRLLVLAGAVLVAHALLIALWAPGARRVGSGHGAALRPVLLVPALAVVPPPRPGLPVPPQASPGEPMPPSPPAVAAAQPLPAPQRQGDAAGALPADTAVAGEAVAAVLPLRPPAAASQPAIELDPEAEAGAPPPPAEGAPPPVYATRIPLPALLRYRVLLTPGGAAAAAPGLGSGEARLLLRHDGQRYTLALDAQASGRPWIEQQSLGGFDSAGFAPERFIDRRRGRGWRAANFRRDTGRIGFSGPRIDYPLLPGTQDRLSAVAQLSAIVAAAPDTVAGELRVFVADARGWAELWRWQAEGGETVDTPLGPLALVRWRREPERPEGLRVEAWLDPARGHWPARLRYTLLRSGQVLDLLLAAEPAPPP